MRIKKMYAVYKFFNSYEHYFGNKFNDSKFIVYKMNEEDMKSYHSRNSILWSHRFWINSYMLSDNEDYLNVDFSELFKNDTSSANFVFLKRKDAEKFKDFLNIKYEEYIKDKIKNEKLKKLEDNCLFL